MWDGKALSIFLYNQLRIPEKKGEQMAVTLFYFFFSKKYKLILFWFNYTLGLFITTTEMIYCMLWLTRDKKKRRVIKGVCWNGWRLIKEENFFLSSLPETFVFNINFLSIYTHLYK